jgi:hypothetical protein
VAMLCCNETRLLLFWASLVGALRLVSETAPDWKNSREWTASKGTLCGLFYVAVSMSWPPLWSEFLATDPEARVRFPALPKKKSSGSGTGSTQPREYKLRSYLIEK